MSYTGAYQRVTPVNAAFTWNEDYVLSGDEVTNDIVCWCSRTGALVSRIPGKFPTYCFLLFVFIV